LIALLAAVTNASLGRNTASILQDNYRSVLAVEQMKEALDRLDAATTPPAAPSAGETRDVAPNLARFEQALSVQRSNVTERGEPAATAALIKAWTAYRDALTRGLGGAEPLRALYLEARRAADRILELNQDAMVGKRDRARREADRA